MRDSLIQLLRAYLDVFAWSYEDMPGLDPSISIVCHFCPMPDRGRVPGVAGQCRPCSQKDGKVRVCVDFRDLNKASPKDDFPLPHIDMLVDSTAGHSMLSFMDGFSGTVNLDGSRGHGEDVLHYRVGERGIEVDPDKIRAILTCLHRGQRLPGQTSCQRIREDQRVLVVTSYTRPSSTLILVRLRRGLGCMLAQLDDSGKDRAIYYLNPLRYLFDRPALVGRLMRWLVLLTEFDIHYVTQKSIRGSIVADH
ncbi:hypothetical protein CK203_059159 [Vitis vinifera]|uniref:Reverse transcriptase RNase H-like domain-containing protein n=1 Tax=Vitis vinifera TaxID=29760 RepID=A0A438GM26_VITVI|nr:hypothetical protein CK203_059159 [Vitis vinifera]